MRKCEPASTAAMNMSELNAAITEVTSAVTAAPPGSAERRELECRRNRMLRQQQARRNLINSLAAVRQRRHRQGRSAGDG